MRWRTGRRWVTALLTVALVAATPSIAPAKDVDAAFIESYRAEQLGFGRGGRAYIRIERIWEMDQLHWAIFQPTPRWHACIIVWYRNGEVEQDCGSPRIRSAIIDPLLRGANLSFSLRSLDYGPRPPWRVELEMHQRAATSSEKGITHRRSVDRTNRPSVGLFAEGAAWSRESRPQVTRGWIESPSGRRFRLRTAGEQGGRLARFVRGAATTGWWSVGRPHMQIPPQPPTVPPLTPCVPPCPPPR